MGNLSNLYISQSYISLLHLGSNNTASTTLTAVEDGLGNSIGVSVNTAGDVAIAGTLSIKRGLDITGSVKINTTVTSSTQQFVNSGNQFTDNIIRITGSYSSGSTENPGVYQIQNGWKCFGEGLGDDGATVIANTYVPGTGWTFTIDENTAVWFGLYNFTDPNKQYINFAVSGSEDITGSLWVRDKFSVTDISASGNISCSNLWVQNTIHAYKLDVTIESASIIFTSGSNIIGDEANVDTQTLIGRVIVSGSLEVTGSTRINGNTTITGSTNISGSITASGNISSSTLSGVGNVSLYSASVSQRIETNSSSFYNFSSSAYKIDSASFTTRIETNSASFYNFSGSQYKNDSSSFDSRLDLVESTSSFLQNTFSASQYKSDSSSFDSRIDTLEAWSGSITFTYATVVQLNASSSQLQSNINTKLDTASFNSYTSSISSSNSLVSQSFVTTINNLSSSVATSFSASAASQTNLSASIYLTDSTQSNSIISLTAKTGSYATTGSNNFIGNQTITGSLTISSSADIELNVIGKSTYSGSVRGNVIPLTIASNTASLDCSLGNFYTLTLVSGSTTQLTATNINPGQTLSLRVSQPAVSYGTLTYDSTIKFSQYSPYFATPLSSSIDIISFQSYDTTALYGGAVQNLV